MMPAALISGNVLKVKMRAIVLAIAIPAPRMPVRTDSQDTAITTVVLGTIWKVAKAVICKHVSAAAL
jgi:hypothetical protein